LTIRPDAWFSKTGLYSYSRTPELYERYDYARKKIIEAGYVQESNVRFKIQGRGGYVQKTLQFDGAPYLGLGVGARSYTNSYDYMVGNNGHNSKEEIGSYMNSINTNSLTIDSLFKHTDEERIRKRICLDLFDLDLRELEEFNWDKHSDEFIPLLDILVKDQLLFRVGETRFQLTPEGYKYRDIISTLMFSEKIVELDRDFYQQIEDKNDRLKLIETKEVEWAS
jgi:oxygen-independent coproporphyrinogen-3 oxidase